MKALNRSPEFLVLEAISLKTEWNRLSNVDRGQLKEQSMFYCIYTKE